MANTDRSISKLEFTKLESADDLRSGASHVPQAPRFLLVIGMRRKEYAV